MRVCLVTLLVSVAVAASAQFPPDVKCLVSNGQGYAFGNPRQIAVGLASELVPSQDGKFLAFRRVLPMDPLDEIRGKAVTLRVDFSIWNSQTDQVWNVAEAGSDAPTAYEFAWSPTMGQGVLVQSRSVQVSGAAKLEVLVDRVVANSKQRQTVSRYVLDPGSRVDPSPNGRYVLVPGLDGGTRDEVLEVASGQHFTIPHGTPGEARFWGADGELIVYRRQGEGKPTMLRVDLASQQLVAYAPLRNPELEPDPFVVYPVDLTGKDGSSRVLAASTGSKLRASVTAAAEGGASVNVRPPTPPETAADKLVHEDPGLAGPVILDADPSSQVISSNGRYVAYAKRGGVYICPFEPVDADYLKKIVATRAKLQAMNKAKQVAVALIIYGADYDDILPPNGNWKDSVYPYLKNRDMTNGFNYILDGQNMTGIDEPANMELGSIDTPYGRAIAYVDGHVKWVPAVAPESLYLSLFGEDRRRAGL